MKITTNINGVEVTTPLQITTIDIIPQGDFSLPDNKPFLVKNITDDTIEITCVPIGMAEEVTTVLQKGWNCEILKEIKNVKENTLQYGY